MMEFCEGGKVDDLDYMKLNNISSDEVIKPAERAISV